MRVPRQTLARRCVFALRGSARSDLAGLSGRLGRQSRGGGRGGARLAGRREGRLTAPATHSQRPGLGALMKPLLKKNTPTIKTIISLLKN